MTRTSPRWDNSYRSGLQAAVEVPSSNGTSLSWGSASVSNEDIQVFYNIYYSNTLSSLFNTPKKFSLGLSGLISRDDAPDGYYFGVNASNLGITSNFDGYDTTTIYSYPENATSVAAFSTIALDSYLQVNSTEGFPEEDGYIQIGDEIIHYSATTQYSGNPSFVINSWDPFNCNDGYAFASGEEVSLFKGFEEGNTVSFRRRSVCLLPRPTWENHLKPGIYRATDLGLGRSIEIEWGPATPPLGQSKIYYNVYYNSDLDSLFDYPQAITDQETVIVPNLRSGDGYFFGVRATYYPENLDFDEFTEISENLYELPQSTVVAEFSGSYLSTDTGPMVVNSTSAFPSSGYIKVNDEIMTYGSTTPATFIIDQRDYFDRDNLQDHINGSVVRLFRGVESTTHNYFRAVPTWDGSGNGPWLSPDGYEVPGSMQDEDGYRVWKTDILNEDHSDFEEAYDDVDERSRCGLRSADFYQHLTGQGTNTYHGGGQNGVIGINLNTENIQREEFLLAHTGKPFTLLRLKTTGRQCPKFSLRHEHSHERCGLCYGTRFLGGYDKYVNQRNWFPGRTNVHGTIPLRVAPYKNDLPLLAERGLAQVDQLTAWGMPIPIIKKRDILIGYILDENRDIIQEEFRYEVVSVTRNQILFGFEGKQEMLLRKLDHDNIVYTIDNFPFDDRIA